MKTSFIIGWCCLFIVCIFFNSVIEQNSGITSTQMAWLNTMMTPQLANMAGTTSILTQAISFIINVGSYFVSFLLMIFLWFPSIWTGVWIWFYFVFCLPVAVGFAASIVIILRGVHNA